MVTLKLVLSRRSLWLFVSVAWVEGVDRLAVLVDVIFLAIRVAAAGNDRLTLLLAQDDVVKGQGENGVGSVSDV